MKIAIIGASYLQLPLIEKAKERGIETHVFAWAANDVGECIADYFYPISIVEKEEILKKCREIKIDGICTIASDLAAITVSYVAEKMGLIGNPIAVAEVSTNKNKMRRCFEENGDPSPISIQVDSANDVINLPLSFPIIVKPVDRSGSRGITKIEEYDKDAISKAVNNAIQVSFEKKALIEEYVTGLEYSVEFISWKGKHEFLSITQKYTTGAPGYVETAHFEPAYISEKKRDEIIEVVSHALTSIGIKYGASHSELKITESGDIKLIEIGGRMGGDFIGSTLVELSTGYDFVSAVIDVALGIQPNYSKNKTEYAAVRFVVNQDDITAYNTIQEESPERIVDSKISPITGEPVQDSSTRFGYFIFVGNTIEEIEKYLPQMIKE